MSEPTTPPEANPPDVLSLARAVRFALFCMVLGVAVYILQASYQLGNFSSFLRDMLGPESQFPFVTRMVVLGKTAWLIIGLVVPVICFLQLFSRKIIRSIYIMGVGGLVLLFLAVMLHNAVTSSLLEIFGRLSGG